MTERPADMILLERLADLGRLTSRSVDVRTVAQHVVDDLRMLVPVLRVTLYRGDPGSNDFSLIANSTDREVTIVSNIVFTNRTGMPGLAASEGRLVVTPNLLTDPRVRLEPDLRTYWESTPIRAVAAVPLVGADAILGVLTLSDREGRVFSNEEPRILEMYAAQATVALENARLYARLADKTQRLKVLHRLALGLTATLGGQEIFTAVARAALELFGDVGCSLWLLEPGTDVLTLVADEGVRFPELRPAGTMKAGQGLVGRVVAERRHIIIENVEERGHNRALSRAEGFRTAMAVPLLLGEQCFGGLSVRRRSLEPFFSEDVDLLTALAGHAAITIERSRLCQDVTRTNEHLRAQASGAFRSCDTAYAKLSSSAFLAWSCSVSLQGMVGLLAEACADRLGKEGLHYVARIGATIKHMEGLIADLLALARAGREGREAETVALEEVVDLVLQRLDEPLRTRGFKVTRGALGEVRAIRTHIEQVFSNLIGNAVKYIGERAEPCVEIGRGERDGVVEYHVRDNGIGIDPAYHEVFETFQRLKEVEVEGSGVGLAIVKKIVESAGGALRIESAPGAGATFFFTWPGNAEATR
ncbi:MAG: GAF domain-containing protein [Candidatus Rokubacteria bacterium]|nr:GAF domain-containing protein [Candidatus Rokubacteria bacterium]